MITWPYYNRGTLQYRPHSTLLKIYWPGNRKYQIRKARQKRQEAISKWLGTSFNTPNVKYHTSKDSVHHLNLFYKGQLQFFISAYACLKYYAPKPILLLLQDFIPVLWNTTTVKTEPIARYSTINTFYFFFKTKDDVKGMCNQWRP